MKILMGTKNPGKIEGARQAFEKYFDNIDIEGIAVESNVGAQPVNEEILQGAKNRIKNLKKYANNNNIKADFYIASEAGITNLLGEWIDINAVIIEDRNGFQSFGTSQGFPIPDKYIDEIKETELGNVVLDLSRYEKEIIYNLRRMTVSEIAELPDVNEGLEHSLKNAANYSNDITNLINIVKTKRYTVTRIQRILICALLGITKRDVGMAKKAEPYIRVLGFNEKGKELISRINKQNPKATVITSVKKFQDKNNNNKNSKIYKRLLDIDIFSTNVYTMACKSESLANLDYTKNMVIL